MTTKLKERIIDWVKKNDIKEFDWKGVAIALGVPKGSATGRLSELCKDGVLCRRGREKGAVRYGLENDAFDALRKQHEAKTKTAYFYLLDASTSMGKDNLERVDRRPTAARLVNESIAAIKAQGQDDSFYISYFSGSVWPHYGSEVPPHYRTMPTGTALVDAILDALKRAARCQEPKSILVFTDGEENAGGSWAALKTAIELAEARGDTTVAILVPAGSKGEQLLKDNGVPAGNIKPWGTMEEARTAAVEGATSFSQARQRGTRSVKNYFRADLSHVTIKDFERDLTEITPQIRRWLSNKESTIEDLIKSKTGSYEPGTGFFEVTKREGRIKGDRKFLIMEPTTGRVFADGKRTVRSVCGYPEGDIAIKPGNHSGYILLGQSKSSTADTFRARILPRGTSVVLWPAGR